MARNMQTVQSTSIHAATTGVTERTIGGKKYIVRSVFVGEQDAKTMLLKLAEQRAIREMGLDSAVP